MTQSILKSIIYTENDVMLVRNQARAIALLLQFDQQDQIRIATAVSEIARNAFQYAKGGQVEFLVEENNKVIKYVVVIKDNGPGIDHLDKILIGTYVSPQGMGVGITGARRLMDEVEIQSTSTAGSSITLKKVIPNRTDLLSDSERTALYQNLLTDPKTPLEELQRQNQEILLTVTALNEKKQELLRLNKELEDTNRGVVALYAELDEKAEILRLANESKTSFLADMTHEFRSPLNSILSISQILLSEAKKESAPEREKQVNFIVKAARGLSDLVNDLLDIAKIEAGKINVRPGSFPIGDLFSSLRGLMRPLGTNENVELNIQDPESIILNTDEAKLTQILRNLIANSLKYTESGSIEVRARLVPNQRVCFSVRDSGIGIPTDDLEGIFEEFYQVENPLQQLSKGTGLGLPLSRRLAQLLGGTLRVESVHGQGSTFFLELPVTYTGLHVRDYQLPATKLDKVIPNSARPPMGKKKVLIVDDDEGIRYSLRSMLQEFNVDVREGSDGVEGWNIAKVYLPDLIILDMAMPHRDGLDFIEDCLGQLSTRAIPIILHTSKELEPEERSYLEQVNIAILEKDGNSYDLLKQAIKNVLRIS